MIFVKSRWALWVICASSSQKTFCSHKYVLPKSIVFIFLGLTGKFFPQEIQTSSSPTDSLKSEPNTLIKHLSSANISAHVLWQWSWRKEVVCKIHGFIWSVWCLLPHLPPQQAPSLPILHGQFFLCRCEFECEWLFVSMCQSCDELMIHWGWTPLLAQCQLRSAPAPCDAAKVKLTA